MDVRRALGLSFRSTNNSYYAGQLRPIEEAIAAGDGLAESFDQTRAFPPEFVDVLRVAEQSGRISESMGHLAGQYRHQAEVAMKALATAGGFAVWALIAGFIIYLIFSLASSYVSTLKSFM